MSAPTVICLELHLAGADPLDPNAWRTWDRPPRPSATRPRRSKKADP